VEKNKIKEVKMQYNVYTLDRIIIEDEDGTLYSLKPIPPEELPPEDQLEWQDRFLVD